MAILFGLIPFALQLLLIIHVLKTRRDFFWIYLLIFLPLVGGLAYIVVEILPGIGRSRAVRSAGQAVAKAINPTRRMRELESLLALQDTVRNRLDLAGEYRAGGLPEKAVDVLKGCLTGVHADDPELRHTLAQALVESGQAAEALPLLARLEREGRLESVSDKISVLRAREAAGEDTLSAYRLLYEADKGLESGYWHVAALVKAGRREEAAKVVQEMRDQLKRFRQFKRTMGTQWLERAAKILG
jgi:hypothetical protein